MASKLYVGGLAYSTTSESLRTLFAQHGTVESAAVVSDRDSGQSRGFGFVEMSTQPEAEEAIAKLDGQSFEGRPLKVNVANPKGSGGRGSWRPTGHRLGIGQQLRRRRTPPVTLVRDRQPGSPDGAGARALAPVSPPLSVASGARRSDPQARCLGIGRRLLHDEDGNRGEPERPVGHAAEKDAGEAARSARAQHEQVGARLLDRLRESRPAALPCARSPGLASPPSPSCGRRPPHSAAPHRVARARAPPPRRQCGRESRPAGAPSTAGARAPPRTRRSRVHPAAEPGGRRMRRRGASGASRRPRARQCASPRGPPSPALSGSALGLRGRPRVVRLATGAPALHRGSLGRPIGFLVLPDARSNAHGASPIPCALARPRRPRRREDRVARPCPRGPRRRSRRSLPRPWGRTADP